MAEEVRVEYTSGRDFQSVAKQFRIMNDLKVSFGLGCIRVCMYVCM